MDLTKQLLFFLSALGAFNGLLLAGYISYAKRSQLSYLLLGGLLFFISLRVGKSVLFYFSPELSRSILQFGLSACFLIGPFTFLFVQSLLNQKQSLSLQGRWHLGLLLLLVVVVGFSFPYQSNPELWGGWIYKIINYQWLLYLLVTLFVLYRAHSRTKVFAAMDKPTKVLLVSVYSGVSVIWLAYYTASYTSYLVGALSFSFLLYMSVLLFMRFKQERKVEKYQDKRIAKDTAEQLIEQLQRLMTQEQVFCQANITLAKLAKLMGISSPQLSQLLNDNINKSFTTFINEYRVNKAKHILLTDSRQTMENVAEACGYNSMSTFYSAFKKIEQTTPAQYRQDRQK